MVATRRRGLAVRRGAHQEIRDRADGVLGGGEADAQQTVAAEGSEAFERESQVGAALVRRDGVDFVDDHRSGGREHLAAGLRAQQDVERFRGGDEDMRRPLAHPCALGGRRVARAHPGADLDIGEAAPLQLLPDAGQRRLEVAVNIVRQRLERRDVDDLRRIGQRGFEPLAHQVIYGRQKRGQGFAGAGRRGDQRMPAGL
ncbi:MAG: hypothetical protein WDN49_04880 [Acetobacteraceae bacterium]